MLWAIHQLLRPALIEVVLQRTCRPPPEKRFTPHLLQCCRIKDRRSASPSLFGNSFRYSFVHHIPQSSRQRRGSHRAVCISVAPPPVAPASRRSAPGPPPCTRANSLAASNRSPGR